MLLNQVIDLVWKTKFEYTGHGWRCIVRFRSSPFYKPFPIPFLSALPIPFLSALPHPLSFGPSPSPFYRCEHVLSLLPFYMLLKKKCQNISIYPTRPHTLPIYLYFVIETTTIFLKRNCSLIHLQTSVSIKHASLFTTWSHNKLLQFLFTIQSIQHLPPFNNSSHNYSRLQ